MVPVSTPLIMILLFICCALWNLLEGRPVTGIMMLVLIFSI
jgi:hypothetical protein